MQYNDQGSDLAWAEIACRNVGKVKGFSKSYSMELTSVEGNIVSDSQ